MACRPCGLPRADYSRVERVLVHDATIAQNEAVRGGIFVRSQIPAARIPGLGERVEEDGEVRKAGCRQARQHVWAEASQHAGNADGLAVRRVRSAAPECKRAARAMSEVRVRSARLQTVRVLR